MSAQAKDEKEDEAFKQDMARLDSLGVGRLMMMAIQSTKRADSFAQLALGAKEDTRKIGLALARTGLLPWNAAPAAASSAQSSSCSSTSSSSTFSSSSSSSSAAKSSTSASSSSLTPSLAPSATATTEASICAST